MNPYHQQQQRQRSTKSCRDAAVEKSKLALEVPPDQQKQKENGKEKVQQPPEDEQEEEEENLDDDIRIVKIKRRPNEGLGLSIVAAKVRLLIFY